MTQGHVKHASADHPIHELLARRWSPYAYDPRPVERAALLTCLEAARWAASSFNEQPWSFLVAAREEEAEFARMLACLMEANQAWARNAGVLMLTVAARTFTRNGKPNRVAEHDVGMAVAGLTVQATDLGLVVHEMAGVNLARARQQYAIPESHDPLTAIALGYAADVETFADAGLAQRDRTPRARKPLGDFVFAGTWGRPGCEPADAAT